MMTDLDASSRLQADLDIGQMLYQSPADTKLSPKAASCNDDICSDEPCSPHLALHAIELSLQPTVSRKYSTAYVEKCI
jgi:hypothetical protein